nr:MAG TPA: hypothetical protein [Caudoviricetes sp.]DAN50962.1 MAG TPA: hypothetical protein [Caudoviricetes sp.]DAP21132.1 MAG TPA: hypothetical protein [Caudoviricetes sp.]
MQNLNRTKMKRMLNTLLSTLFSRSFYRTMAI